MTTGRINQVATSRPAHKPAYTRLSSEVPLGVPTCRNALPDPQCPRTSRVFSMKRPDHCDQWYTSKNPGLRPQALSSPPPRPKGPSCCLLASFLSTSYRGAAVVGRLLPWAPKSASRGPSGRCAIVGLRCAVRAASLLHAIRHKSCRRRCLTPSVR